MMSSTKVFRSLKEDAYKYSGLVVDNRFANWVRYVDWVDLKAREESVFRGAYIKDGNVEVNLGVAKVIMVKAALGDISKRRAFVKVLVLQKNGYISATRIFADASKPGWPAEIKKPVFDLLMRLKKEKEQPETGEDETSMHASAAGMPETAEIIITDRMKLLLASAPAGMTLNRIIEFALSRIHEGDIAKIPFPENDDQIGLPS